MTQAQDSPKFTDFKIIFFDVYGTLADWETGIYTAIKPLLAKYPASSKWTRSEALLAYENVERDLQVQSPDLLYRDLLTETYKILEQRLNAASETQIPADPEAAIAFGQSIKDFPLFPDTTEALHKLAKRYKLCVLSNVDRRSFGGTHAKLTLGNGSTDEGFDAKVYGAPDGLWLPQTSEGTKSPFTLLVTAEDVGAYKPAQKGFDTVLELARTHSALLGEEKLSLAEVKKQVLWVAQSVHHDIQVASRLGLQTTWINRQGAEMGSGSGASAATWTFNTLGEFSDAVESDFGGR